MDISANIAETMNQGALQGRKASIIKKVYSKKLEAGWDCLVSSKQDAALF